MFAYAQEIASKATGSAADAIGRRSKMSGSRTTFLLFVLESFFIVSR